MPRRLPLLAALAAGLLMPGTAMSADRPANPKNDKPAKKERPKIAVMDFDDRNVSKSEAAIVSDAVRSALFDTRRFTVLDKGHMQQILEEHAFQKSGCTAAECAVELGKLLNMQFMVIGEVSLLGNQETGVGEYSVTVRAINVESGKMEASKDVLVDAKVKLRGAAKEAARAITPMIGGETDLLPDSGGFFQDVLTVIGIVGVFVGAVVAGQ